MGGGYLNKLQNAANITAEQNVGRVSASVTRRATGETNENVGLRDKAANPTYGAGNCAMQPEDKIVGWVSAA